MKRKLLLFTLMVGLLLGSLAQAQNLDPVCTANCDRINKGCIDYGQSIYDACMKRSGTTAATCEQERNKNQQQCLNDYGCKICFIPGTGDWRYGILGTPYYCECGPRTGEEELACGVRNYEGECSTPVLVDVAGDGLRLTNVATGVIFDLQASGAPVRTAWTESDSDDAWLVLDRDGNGTIDYGSELFGNFTPQPYSPNRNGFLALAEFDKPVNGGNADGLITSADAVFTYLRLWQDKNHNGVSEPAELLLPASVGVEQIDLEYQETRRVDQHGNLFRYRAKINGSRSAWDVFLVISRQ